MSLELPGWTAQEAASHFANERTVVLESAGRVVRIERCWAPLKPDRVMDHSSRRVVQVDGHPKELLTARALRQGVQHEISVLLLRGEDWLVRVEFEGVSPDEAEAICASIRLHASFEPPCPPLPMACLSPAPSEESRRQSKAQIRRHSNAWWDANED